MGCVHTFQYTSTPAVLQYAERRLSITIYMVVPPGLQVAKLLPEVLLLLGGVYINLSDRYYMDTGTQRLNQGCVMWNERLWADILKMATHPHMPDRAMFGDRRVCLRNSTGEPHGLDVPPLHYQAPYCFSVTTKGSRRGPSYMPKHGASGSLGNMFPLNPWSTRYFTKKGWCPQEEALPEPWKLHSHQVPATSRYHALRSCLDRSEDGVADDEAGF